MYVVASLVDSKKEIIIASLMAITVALGLGVASYSFFIGTPTPKTLEILLDLYTQKGGAGANASGGIFEPNDIAQLYAFLTNGGVPVNNATITYMINNTEGVQSTRTAFTNESGIADGNFSFLLSQDSSILGTWHILATAHVENKTASDTLSLLCKPLSPILDVYTQKGGYGLSQPSLSFAPYETVHIYAQVRDELNKTVPYQWISFEIGAGANSQYKSAETNESGTAEINFTMPESTFDTYVAYAAYQYPAENADIPLFDTVTFKMAGILDAFTQQGGTGLRQDGGAFALNETVVLSALVRGSTNQAMSLLVTFDVTSPNGTFLTEAVQTDGITGLASKTFTLPTDPSYLGQWTAEASASYNDVVLSDVVTFTCQ